jgi:hypothetical protein
MTQARSDRRRAPSRPTRDPSYRPTPVERNGTYHPFTVSADAVLLACSTCASLIPNSDRARTRHSRWHAVYGLDRA